LDASAFVLSSKEVGKNYKSARKDLDRKVETALAISLGSGGRVSKHSREYWSSVIFTKLLITSLSILKLMPSSDDSRSVLHWDFSAVATLSRGIMEGYLQFYHLCVNEVLDEEDWQMRQQLMQVKDAQSRKQMMQDSDENFDTTEYDSRIFELSTALNGNKHFAKIADKQRFDLLRGRRQLFIQDDVLDKLGQDKRTFRTYYKFLSSHVHTLPMSFYRMAEQGRGHGEENDHDKLYMTSAALCVAEYLGRASKDMKKIHKNCESDGRRWLRSKP
jgi:hypothetical protein